LVLWEVIGPYLHQAKAGDDHMRSLGVCLLLEVLEEACEEVLVI
jgi:hypothetical protein